MRSAERAASQLPGRWPTGVHEAPAPDVNKKNDYEIMRNLCRTRIYNTLGICHHRVRVT